MHARLILDDLIPPDDDLMSLYVAIRLFRHYEYDILFLVDILRNPDAAADHEQLFSL